MKNFQLLLVIDTLIKLGVAATLIVAATTNQQYSFYIFLRWLVFVTFLYFSYRSYIKKETGLIFLFLGVAVIFNPAQKYVFQKETWHLIDYLISSITLLTIVYPWFYNNLATINPSTSMNDKTLFKKRIAREVLLFFAAIGLVGLVWVSLLLRNTYYNSREQNLKEEIISLTTQLDTLPSDKIKEIYDGLCNNFVLNYRIVKDTILENFNQDDNGDYAIPKRSEDDFLTDFPKAFRLQNYPKGYSYIHTYSITLKDGEVIKYSDKAELGKLVKAKYPEYSDIADIELAQKILNKYSQHSDSTIVFDFIDLESFRNFLKQEDYRDKFYQIFRWEKYLRVVENQDRLPVFKKKIAYDLGSQEVFESNVQLGLKYDKAAIESRNKIEQEIISNEETIKTVTASIWDTERIKWFLLTTVLIIAIILYPLRLTFLLIKWALRTVR